MIVPLAPPPPPLLIVPGVRIGPAVLGATRAATAAAVPGRENTGSIVTTELGGRLQIVSTPAARISATYRLFTAPPRATNRSVLVSTNGTRYRTAKGIGVGSTRAALKAAHPAAVCEGSICRIGAALPGRRVTTFRMAGATAVGVEIGFVLD